MNTSPHNTLQEAAIERILAGGGEMGALMRTIDWSQTPLGAIDTWSPSLLTAVGICLASRFPMIIFWGHDLIEIYNDAARPIFGIKHPQSLGQMGEITWAEIWQLVGPMLRHALFDSKATWAEDALMPMDRYGYV
jgi:hypothetical protein